MAFHIEIVLIFEYYNLYHFKQSKELLHGSSEIER